MILRPLSLWLKSYSVFADRGPQASVFTALTCPVKRSGNRQLEVSTYFRWTLEGRAQCSAFVCERSTGLEEQLKSELKLSWRVIRVRSDDLPKSGRCRSCGRRNKIGSRVPILIIGNEVAGGV